MPTLIAAAHRNCRIKIGAGARRSILWVKTVLKIFSEASVDYYCPTVVVAIVVQCWFRAAHRKISMRIFFVVCALESTNKFIDHKRQNSGANFINNLSI